MKNKNEQVFYGYEYDKTINKNKRKINGSFYTPNFIIDYIIENTIEVEKVILNPFIRVLDPSCGSGYFLVKVYDKLKNILLSNLKVLNDKFKNENYKLNSKGIIKNIKGSEYWVSENVHYHIIKHCIFGADIDENAVKFANMNLIEKDKNNFIEPNIICCDSLIPWEKDLNSGEKFNFWSEKFDYIIGNPPWVSLNRKHGHKNFMTEQYMQIYSGNKYLPNLYEYFITRSIEILKDKGNLGFIVPDRLAKNLNLKDMREKILKNYNLICLNFEVEFPGITTDTMIFIIKKAYDIKNKIKLDIYNKRTYFIFQKEYLRNLNFEFSYENKAEFFNIKEKIDNSSVKLSSISTTFTGFIGEKKKISKVKTKKEEIPIVKGENIDYFKIKNKYYYEFIPENLKGGTQNLKKLAHPMKVIVRKTGKNLIAALENKGYAIEQSLYGIINIKDKYSCKYLLGILNSSLIQWYYRNFLVTNLNSTPQIKKCDLDNIPIKACNESQVKVIEELVSEIINISDDEKLKSLKYKLDEIIFKLYEINDIDKKIIEE